MISCVTKSAEEKSMKEGNIYLRCFFITRGEKNYSWSTFSDNLSSSVRGTVPLDFFSQKISRQTWGDPFHSINFLRLTHSIWTDNVPLDQFSQTNCLYLEGRCSEWVNIADKVWKVLKLSDPLDFLLQKISLDWRESILLQYFCIRVVNEFKKRMIIER